MRRIQFDKIDRNSIYDFSIANNSSVSKVHNKLIYRYIIRRNNKITAEVAGEYTNVE